MSTQENGLISSLFIDLKDISVPDLYLTHKAHTNRNSCNMIKQPPKYRNIFPKKTKFNTQI